MGDQKRYRDHSPEFRIRIAERMAAGETVTALASEFGLTRSMMYRWRDAYRKEGAAGLQGSRGRPRGPGRPPRPKTASPVQAKSPVEQQLRERIAELEAKVGRQAVEIDFFRGVFRRLDELPQAPARGGDASTRKL